MKTLNELRLFSSYYVVEMSNNNNNDKEIFLKFIKEADEKQLYYLLTKGSMLQKNDPKLNEFEVAGVAGQTIVHLTKGDIQIGAIVAALAISAFALSVGMNFYNELKIKQCRGYQKGAVEYKRCAKRVKVKAHEKIIITLKTKSALCKNTKDSNKCKRKVGEKVIKIQGKINKLKHEIKELDKKIAN